MPHAAVRPLAATVAAACCLIAAGPADAGGLVWNLPAPGAFVRYEGELTQTLTDRRNQTSEVVRLRQITVRSLDAETAEWDGRQVPARWLEVVSETGTPGERGLDPGPAGRVLYKVLVPESAVSADLADPAGIPHAFLPVLRGWRQVGDLEPAELGPAFRAYPTLTLLTDFEPREVTSSEPDAADTPAGSFDGTRYTAKSVEESPRARLTLEANWVVSPAVPFGPAAWEATLTREIKDASADRDAFREAGKSVERLELVEIGADARGELPLP